MQRLEVSGAVRPIYGSLGVKRLIDPEGALPKGRICAEGSVGTPSDGRSKWAVK